MIEKNKLFMRQFKGKFYEKVNSLIIQSMDTEVSRKVDLSRNINCSHKWERN